jgi:hypothetical protein
VLAGLRLKELKLSSQKSHLKFEVCFDFFPLHKVIFILVRASGSRAAPSRQSRIVARMKRWSYFRCVISTNFRYGVGNLVGI